MLDEELEEDEDAVLDVVPLLLPLCVVEEEIVDEVAGGLRTSKLVHIKSIYFSLPER